MILSKLALFDFDGTITSKDTFLDFIRFVRGWPAFVVGMLLLSPASILFLCGIIKNSTFKELMLRLFLRGMPVEVLKRYGHDYAEKRLPGIIRHSAKDRLDWHKNQGHEIVIISASSKEWMESWALKQGYSLISTRLESKNGLLTGALEGENCFGQEKVRRLKAEFDIDKYSYVYAYGDSKGDREMLSLAHESNYKPFLNNPGKKRVRIL